MCFLGLSTVNLILVSFSFSFQRLKSIIVRGKRMMMMQVEVPFGEEDEDREGAPQAEEENYSRCLSKSLFEVRIGITFPHFCV